MNTPRSKPPIRFGSNFPRDGNRPNGQYTQALNNTDFLSHLGYLASFWPHVEDSMIIILEDLLGGGPGVPARQIFRSIVSNEARKKVMLGLLERAQINRSKDRFYDDIIAEFYSLNGIRNDYIHGLWATHESGRVFLTVESVDDFHFLAAREVKSTDLEATIEQMHKLNRKLIDHLIARVKKRTAEGGTLTAPPPQPPELNKT